MSRGRPQVNKEKRRTTSVTLTDTNYDFYKANDLNLSKTLNDAIDAMQKIDNFKLHEIEAQILKIKSDLNIYQEEYKKLMIDIEQKEEIRRSQKINEEYPAFYLRKMYFEGHIERRISLDFMDAMKRDEEIQKFFTIEGRTLIKRDGNKLSPKAEQILRNIGVIKKNGKYEIPQPHFFLVGKGLNNLQFNHDLFLKEIEEDFLTEDLREGYFCKFSPKITDPNLARQVREEYSKILMTGKIEWKGDSDAI